MSSTERSLALAAAGLAAVLAVGACGSSTDSATPQGGMSGHSGSMPGMSTSSPASPSNAAARAGDVMFAQMMIPHHQQAVEMADLALAKRSAAANVLGLARQIKAAQAPEISTMKGWLGRWGAPTAAAMDHGSSGMMSDEDMASLKAAEGAEFNRTWLEMMIDHHRGAVTMARDVLSTTGEAEVERLARAIIAGQEKEIALMQGMLGSTP